MKFSILLKLSKSNCSKIAFFFNFSGNEFITFSVLVLFRQANITFAFELSKSFAVSNPIPSEDPVTIINFPVKSFLIGFKGPFAHF